ncbi:hypothetical protein HanPI659440_Chr10g0400171 [Helianthus annuus]|nr:hypothetical protein HanPI659440_Chr10g0400171 [Helianthus annuus]
MNPFGRSNMQRSGSNAGHHHHRQYPSSDDFIDSNFNNKWLQSAGLHHLYSSNPNFQDFGFYGSNNDAASSRSPSFTKYGNVEQVSPNEFSPGLLDLHSFDDTELLTEVR